MFGAIGSHLNNVQKMNFCLFIFPLLRFRMKMKLNTSLSEISTAMIKMLFLYSMFTDECYFPFLSSNDFLSKSSTPSLRYQKRLVYLISLLLSPLTLIGLKCWFDGVFLTKVFFDKVKKWSVVKIELIFVLNYQ